MALGEETMKRLGFTWTPKVCRKIALYGWGHYSTYFYEAFGGFRDLGV